jgi:prepilin-type N-terminal cleavage/methylation domain-containing protein
MPSTLHARRGFTLVELLVAVVVLTIVLGGIYKLLLNTQRVSRAQAERMDMQSNMRAGTLIVPSELREVGYDTTYLPAAGGLAGSFSTVQSDILAMGPTSIRLRAVRRSGIICAVGLTTITVFGQWTTVGWNASGYRAPSVNDDLTIFVEGSTTTGADDRWITRDITGITTAGVNCPALGAIAAGPGTQFTMFGFAGANDPVTSAQITVGSPVRLNEIMEYRLYTDADGRNYLGAQSISAGGGLQPVLGPLNPNNGFNLTYLDLNGNQVACAAPCNGGFGTGDMQQRRRVRTVRLSVVAISDENVSPAGTSANQQLLDSVVTLVTLRNAVHR